MKLDSMKETGETMQDPSAAQAGPSPAITAERVSKEYPRNRFLRVFGRKLPGTVALRDVSLTIREGETVGVLGPNGAGKTTFLKIVSTLLFPSSGQVRVAGHDVCRDPRKVRPLIGLVTCDERSFYWRLSGRQNLRFFAALYGLRPQVAEDRMEELLHTLGLAEAADRRYQEYSSGMKQKLAIARGLLIRPRIVLYDEPTRSLDPLSAHHIRSWIIANRAKDPGQTHLIATNQLNEAEQLCDRVLIINRGVVVADGSIAQIRREWQSRNAAIHRITCRGYSPNGTSLSAEGLLDLQCESAGSGEVMLELRAVAESEALSVVLAHVLRSGGVVLQCETRQVPLDEVFCDLVQDTDQRAAGAGR